MANYLRVLHVALASLGMAAILLPNAGLAASTYQIDTVVGTGSMGDNGPAGLASLLDAQGVCADRAGNIYVADAAANRVRKIDLFGTITTVAGIGSPGYSGDGALATQAQLQAPYGIALDSQGSLYIADLGNNRIRKVTANGVISTFPDNVLKLNAPRNVVVDTAGNVYIAEFGASRILRIDIQNGVTIFAGTGTAGFDNETGLATATRINAPAGMFIDTAGTLYFADSGNGRIRKVVAGIISTVLGGAADGTPVPAQLYLPTAVIADPTGVLWIADNGNHRIRRLNLNLTISTFAGNGRDLAFDTMGNVLQVSGGSLQRLTPTNTLVTIVGDGAFSFHGDAGPATSATLNGPVSVLVDPAGSLWIADFNSARVRKVLPNGLISTVAGNSITDSLLAPSAVALDANGTLYITDRTANRVRRLPVNGTLSGFAGIGSAGNSGDAGPASSAQFNGPNGVVVDGFGNVIVSDSLNNRVRKIRPDGTIAPFAGTGEPGYAGNQVNASTAQLFVPTGLCAGLGGDVFIVDTGNQMLRKVAVDGTISTVAGTGVAGFTGDGDSALNARLRLPRGCAVDHQGNIFIADTGNHVIRMITTGGTISTIAGTGGAPGFSGDGGPAMNALLQIPSGVTVDSKGTLWIADAGNNRIRRLTPGVPLLGELTQTLGYANAASMQTGPVAPGSIISIFGAALGPLDALTGVLQSPSILASKLGETQVFFDSIPGALFYVQDSQINVQVPFEAAGRVAVKVEVRYKGLIAGVFNLPIAAAAPGIFTWNGGTGPVIAMNGDSTLNSATSPAQPAGNLTVFGTGGGSTVTAGEDGRIPDLTLVSLALPVSATIGGQPASVLWAGNTPGNAGVVQFNLVVPSNTPSGPQPLLITIAGNKSQSGVVVYVH